MVSNATPTTAELAAFLAEVSHHLFFMCLLLGWLVLALSLFPCLHTPVHRQLPPTSDIFHLKQIFVNTARAHPPSSRVYNVDTRFGYDWRSNPSSCMRQTHPPRSVVVVRERMPYICLFVAPFPVHNHSPHLACNSPPRPPRPIAPVFCL